MEEVQLKLDESGFGHFYIEDGNEEIAEMEIRISADTLTVQHTEVLPRAEGRGLARKLLMSMVDYARKQALKVVPLCTYVHSQFKRNPEEYADVWKVN